jgi:3,4-dihydroxy-2-butanone 4-phosphate synthase
MMKGAKSMPEQEQFNTIEEAIAEIAAGQMVVVVDDEDRENEGDLIIAAEKVTPEDINFMAIYARGLICSPLTGERLDELELEQMVAHNTDSMETAFTVSVDASSTTTGISAFERAKTIKALVDPKTRPQDLRRPGHIFPLRAKEGGVLRRAGHTEATVEGSNVFAEPGQVWVSENGADWYALAGALHYDNTALWDYSITYTKLENGRTSWTDNKGNSAIQPYYEYPLPEYYPLFDWTEALENSMTLSGILLQTQEGTNEYGNLLPPFPDFGYTDVGLRGTLVDGLLTGDNKAGNPYLGSYTKGNRQYLSVTDGMDLAWAVDENGQPVTFENGVHYVKIVTASNIENGAIGEKSTEVNMVRVAAASESEVGQTAAPSAIKVDGNALALTEGKYIYDNVAVDGPFAVSVDAAEGVNIYINSSRGHNAVFSGMPNHKMIRIIVQEGEKEPVIYYLNLVESSGEPEPAATLTLDPNGGVLGGSSEALTYAFDAHMSHIALPIPTTKNTNLEFAGWYSSDQKLYTTYPSEVKDLTLTARWKEIGSEVPSDTIDVTFRLIGCTLAELEDEFDSIDLADGDYKGAEYRASS